MQNIKGQDTKNSLTIQMQFLKKVSSESSNLLYEMFKTDNNLNIEDLR